LATGRDSQWLGMWLESGESDAIVLQNIDFRDYARTFMPKYNAFISDQGGRKQLVCRNFSCFSEYAEVVVKEGTEYKTG
jgi:hypothetical protein